MTDSEPPGLQPERTVLAWRRTALTSLTVTVIAGREIALDPSIPGWALFVVLMLTTTGIAAGIVVRRRRTVLDAEDSRTFPHLLLSVVAMSVAFAGRCAAVSAW